FFALSVVLREWKHETPYMSSLAARSLKKPSRRASARRSAGASHSQKQARAKSTRLKPATKRSPAGKAPARKATKTRPKAKVSTSAKKATKKAAVAHKKPTKTPSARSKRVPPSKKVLKAKPALVLKRPTPPQPPPQPTRDEAAALKAFEAAHREF